MAFEFQLGTINRVNDSSKSYIYLEFQFQLGAIAAFAVIRLHSLIFLSSLKVCSLQSDTGRDTGTNNCINF